MNYYDFGLAGGLSAAGAEVTVYTCDKTQVPTDLSFTVKTTFKKIWGDEHKLLRAARFSYCLLQTLFDAKRNRIKLVHYHFFHYTTLELLCVVFARFFGFKIVVTAHDVESFAGEHSAYSTSRILAKVDKVIAHNRISKKELIKSTRLTSENIVVIPHGNYLRAIPSTPSRAEARKHLEFKEDHPVLLFFGQIKQVKGLDLLLEALPVVIDRFPALQLVIAGKVWKDDFAKYDELIRKNNLKKHVVLHIRYIPDDEVSVFYRAADLVVLPYRKIYQSGVLLMAMSFGVPTVASDLEGMTEIIQREKNGFIFQTGNKDNLATSLIHALSDKEKLQQVSHAAIEEMNQKYDWQIIGQQTVSLFQSIQ